MPNKGILTNEEIKEILLSGKKDVKVHAPVADFSIGKPIYRLLEAQAQATIDHLAKVDDEELVNLLDSFEVVIDEQIITEQVNKWEIHHGGLRPDSARAILACILPILSARYQRELQETVGETILSNLMGTPKRIASDGTVKVYFSQRFLDTLLQEKKS